jgi:hypothetical protein
MSESRSPEGWRNVAGRAARNARELAAAADLQDSEAGSHLPAELRNTFGERDRYGFAAGTLVERLSRLDPAQRARLLDLVEAARRDQDGEP